MFESLSLKIIYTIYFNLLILNYIFISYNNFFFNLQRSIFLLNI